MLNSGHAIPAVGLGTSRLGTMEEDVVRAIKDAVDVGYRHFDTAALYVILFFFSFLILKTFSYFNEKAIGKALEELRTSGKVKREELFITTKVWSNSHTEELALASVRRSLANLRLEYLDLVLVHWPQSFRSGGDYIPRVNGNISGTILAPVDPTKENFTLAYKGLEQAVALNLTRSIGVSNFNRGQLEKLLQTPNLAIKPAVNQVELHPFLSQKDLLEYATSVGVRLEAYSPLRRGDAKMLENPSLKAIAAKYGKSVAQVVLRWQLQRGVIVIPKTSRRARMVENADLFSPGFLLTAEEVATVETLNADDRLIKFEDSAHLAEYPF